jgi:hypothetical protein
VKREEGFTAAILSLEKNIQEYLTQRRGDAEGNSELDCSFKPKYCTIYILKLL